MVLITKIGFENILHYCFVWNYNESLSMLSLKLKLGYVQYQHNLWHHRYFVSLKQIKQFYSLMYEWRLPFSVISLTLRTAILFFQYSQSLHPKWTQRQILKCSYFAKERVCFLFIRFTGIPVPISWVKPWKEYMGVASAMVHPSRMASTMTCSWRTMSELHIFCFVCLYN